MGWVDHVTRMVKKRNAHRLWLRNPQRKNLFEDLWLTYLITPYSRVLLEKLTDSQLGKKFPTFCGARKFITIHKCPPTFPILSQLDPVHTPTSHFLKIHLNIILPSTPGSPKWSLSLSFSYRKPVHASFLPHKCYIPRPSNTSRCLSPEQCRGKSADH